MPFSQAQEAIPTRRSRLTASASSAGPASFRMKPTAPPQRAVDVLDAVETGHADVHEAHVRAQPAGQLDRLDTVRGLRDHGDVDQDQHLHRRRSGGRQTRVAARGALPRLHAARSSFTALAEDLASRGYVVAGIDHTLREPKA